MLAPNYTRARGMTLVEVMVSTAVLSMIVLSVWVAFQNTTKGIRTSEIRQTHDAIVRNGLARITSEMSMTYLSFNRPLDETKHYTLFEGRDGFDTDSVTFSAFAHLRIRKDADESDQSVIQYFVDKDPDDSSVSHLYRRESRRLTGDTPERMEEFFPAYVVIENVVAFDVKYWDTRPKAGVAVDPGRATGEWVNEWRTMKVDMHPDRLPQRVKISILVRDPLFPEDDPVPYTAQSVLMLQERIDLGKTG